jgi:NADPH:quinone reductase-like Zn-dependent oxidoreductase
MKAVVLNEFGGPEVLTVEDVPIPEPGEGEVLVQTQAAGVGLWDVKLREGQLGPRPFPIIPGAELSGLVAVLGPGVDGVQVGDPVIGYPGMGGCYAEYVVVPANRLALAPERVNPIVAAGLPVAGTTALQGIIELLAVRPGESVLITGAAGGVGSIAVQLAASRDAHVIGTASPDNHGYLERLGAAYAVDYAEPDWVENVRKEAAKGVDALLDCVGGETWPASFGAVRDGGRAVTIVAPPAGLEAPRGISIEYFSSLGTTERLTEEARLVDAGTIDVDVTRTFRLGKAADAHEAVETRHTRGKIVLIVDPTVEQGA